VRAASSKLRRVYGAGPLHLLALIAGFALAGYSVLTLGLAALWNHRVWWQSIAVWFAGAIVVHDLVLFPLYALIHRALASAPMLHDRPEIPRKALNYVRVPLMASGLSFLIFLPGIIRQCAPVYRAATGQTQDLFLGRWLMLVAALFAASAAAYALSVAWERRRARTTDDRQRPKTDR
jgi:hypothetical protein